MARNPSPNDNPSDFYPLAVHLSDTEDLPTPISGIAFSASGALHVITADGIERTMPADVLAAGMIHPMRVVRIYLTGTTVTDPVGFVNASMGVGSS